MPKPEQLYSPTKVEQISAAPLKVQLDEAQIEAVEQRKERDRLDYIDDKKAIESFVAETGEVVEAPRDVTGARVLPVPEVVTSTIAKLPEGPAKLATALLPKKILTQEESRRAEQEFEAKVIPEAFNDYLNFLEKGTATFEGHAGTGDLNPVEGLEYMRTAEGYKLFSEEFKREAGSRGQYLITDKDGRMLTGIQILGTEILGYTETQPTVPGEGREYTDVREAKVGTILRSFLLPETFVTSVGQEILEAAGAVETVEEKEFIDRWAQNQQMGFGLEELGSDIGLSVTKGIQSALLSLMETTGWSGRVTGPDNNLLSEIATSEELSERIADGLWWQGLAISFAMPLDFYMGWATKAAFKGGVKGVQSGARAARGTVTGPAPSATAQSSMVGTFLGRVDIADDLGIRVEDLRVDAVEAAAASTAYNKVADDILKGNDLDAASVKALEEAGVPIGKSPEGRTIVPLVEAEHLVHEAARRGLKYLLREADILDRGAEARLRTDPSDWTFSDVRALHSYVREAVESYQFAKAHMEVDLTAEQRAVAHGEKYGRMKTDVTDDIMFDLPTEVGKIAETFMREQVAIEIATRRGKRLIETGSSRIPKGLTLLTDRIAIPDNMIRQVIRETKKFKIGDQNFAEFINGYVRRINRIVEDPQLAPIPIGSIGSDYNKIQESLLSMAERTDIDGNTVLAFLNDFKQAHSGRGTSPIELSTLGRQLIDLVTEMTARQLAPMKVFDIVDLERIWAGSKEVVLTGEAPKVRERLVPRRGVDVISRIRAARNIQDINELFQPKELKKSPIVKALSASVDYMFPIEHRIKIFGKYDVGGVGIGYSPVYGRAFKNLLDRLGNLNEESRVVLHRSFQDIRRNPEKYAAKYGLSPEELKKDTRIVAYGEANENIFGTPATHFSEMMFAAFGDQLDVGIVLTSRFGFHKSQVSDLAKAKIHNVIQALLDSDDGALGKLMNYARTFTTFSPDYFEFLSGVNLLLSAKSLDDIDPHWVQLKGYYEATDIDAPRFQWNADKTGNNLNILFVNGYRTKIIKDFGKSLAGKYPEIFERPEVARGLIDGAENMARDPINLSTILSVAAANPGRYPVLENNWYILGPSGTPQQYAGTKLTEVVTPPSTFIDEFEMARIAPYTGTPIDVFDLANIIQDVLRNYGADLSRISRGRPRGRIPVPEVDIRDRLQRGPARQMEEIEAHRKQRDIERDFISTLVNAGFKDRVEVAVGGAATNVKAIVQKIFDPLVVGGALDDIMDGIKSKLSETAVLEGDLVLNPVWREEIARLVQDSFEAEYFRHPIVNRIFEDTYVDAVSRNVPASRIEVYLGKLQEKLHEGLRQRKLAEAGGYDYYAYNNFVNEFAAMDDLPLYAFDTPHALKRDLHNVLNNNRLLTPYITLDQTWHARQLGVAESIMEGRPSIAAPFDASMMAAYRADVPSLVSQISAMREALKAADGDTSIGAVRLVRKIANWTMSPMWNDVGNWTRNISKNGVLAGNLIFNPKYHIMNILSAPAILLSTLGATTAAKAMLPKYASIKVLRELYSYDTPGHMGRYANPQEIIVRTPTGKTYTIGDIATLMMRKGVNTSQASAEVRSQMFTDLIRWTGENFGTFGRSDKVKTFFRALYELEQKFVGATGRTMWSDFANATDNYWRTSVMIQELTESGDEAAAIAKGRASMFDYNNLTQLEKDFIMRGIWIYTFRSQAWRQALSNLINNPTRMLQEYKMVRGLPPEEEEAYGPFLSKYKNSKVFLGIKEDPETARRYALFGPDVPMIDAFSELVWATEAFAGLVAHPSTAGPAVKDIGLGLAEQTDPRFKLPLSMAGYELGFGDLREAGMYINPAYINFLVQTGNWESFKAFFNVVAKAPRLGKFTYLDYEWGIHRDDDKARKNWLLLRNALLIAGVDRPIKEWSNILIPNLTSEDLKQAKTTEYDLSGGLIEVGVSTGVLGVEEIPDTLEMQKRVMRGVKEELGVR